jgi:alkyl hydroperoxide reductase subunit AhpF
MGIMDSDVRETVRKYLGQKMTVPARLVVFTNNKDDDAVVGVRTGESSRQTQELMEEIAALSDAIRLEVYDIHEHAELVSDWGILAAPTVALGPVTDAGGNGQSPPRVRFIGYPGGHEFTSFLETLGSIGRDNWGLAEDTVGLLSRVDRDIDIKTFVTPT